MTCYFHLRRLRSKRRSLGRDVTAQLVSALVISRLDYCNSVLTHSPASTLAPLQSRIHSTAAWLVHDLGPQDHHRAGYVRTSMVTKCRENQFMQTLLFGTPCNQWSCTVVSDRVGYSPGNISGHASLRAGRHDRVVPRLRLVSSERAFSGTARRGPLTLDWSPTPSFSKGN